MCQTASSVERIVDTRRQGNTQRDFVVTDQPQGSQKMIATWRISASASASTVHVHLITTLQLLLVWLLPLKQCSRGLTEQLRAPVGQHNASHSPLLTDESVSAGPGSIMGRRKSNDAEFCLQLRADSLSTKMKVVWEADDESDRDLSTYVLRNMTFMWEAASWCRTASPMVAVLVFTWSKEEK